MPDVFSEHRVLIWTAATVLSVLLFVGSLAVIPIVLARLPSDYFVRRRRWGRTSSRGALAGRLALLAVKNLVALALLAAGIVMLVTPGQGLLSIAAGALLLDYPKKRQVEIWLVRRRTVRRTIDRIRRRRGRPPLELPDDREPVPPHGAPPAPSTNERRTSERSPR
jgi:hypothetical protein